MFGDSRPRSLGQQNKFLSAINGEPHRLGSLVHTFHVTQWAPRGEEHVAPLSIQKALHAMRNLKHLCLFWWKPSTILRGCTFRLHTLACSVGLDGAEIFFLLCEFLPARDVKRLQIHHRDNKNKIDFAKIPMDPCPHLESLSLNNEGLIRALIPETRPIPHFQWMSYNTPPPLTIYHLKHLKSLAFYIDMLGMETSFTAHLISLDDLRLYVTVGGCNNLIHHVSKVSSLI